MPKAVDIDERRRDIVDAAARLIALGGLEAATMRDIAAEAGWTTGVVNHYFADKRELMRSTLEHSIRRRRVARARMRGGTPLDDLRRALAAALPLDDEGRRHWLVTLAFVAQATGDAELATVQRAAYRAFRAHVTECVRHVVSLPVRSATERAEHLIAHVDGVALQAMFDPESWPPDRQLAMLDRMLGDLA